MQLNVQVKILDDRIRSEFGFPAYATDMSAGLDLVACIDEPLVIKPGETHLIPTGISVFTGNEHFASIILPRSGLGHKHGLVLGNGTGLIDADYQGPLMVSAFNRNSRGKVDYDLHVEGLPYKEKKLVVNEDCDITIQPGDRIAQLVFLPIARAELEVVDEFHAVTDRGEGGFGSTGVKASA